MDIKSAGILGGCIVAAALIFSLVPRNISGPGQPGAGQAMHIHSSDGDLVVDFSIQTSPSSWEGSKIEGVSDIEFYAGYVVVKTKQGGGMIFYNERTRNLNWSLTKR